MKRVAHALCAPNRDSLDASAWIERSAIVLSSGRDRFDPRPVHRPPL